MRFVNGVGFVVLPVGSRVSIPNERRPYTVRASNVAFSICTKPHFRTVLYFIIDWEQRRRGPENTVFECGAESDRDCQEMLDRLTSGESEVSHRRDVPLDITKITLPEDS